MEKPAGLSFKTVDLALVCEERSDVVQASHWLGAAVLDEARAAIIRAIVSYQSWGGAKSRSASRGYRGCYAEGPEEA